MATWRPVVDLDLWKTSKSRLGIRTDGARPVTTEWRAEQLGELIVCIDGHVDCTMAVAGSWCQMQGCRRTITRKVKDYPGVVAALLLAESLVPDGAQAWEYDELWHLIDAADPWPRAD